MHWIKELKIGDKVFQIERHKKIPNGFWKWEGVVSKIEKGYIEVKYCRVPVSWLEEAILEMKKKSHGNIDRTYFETWTKNYFAPDGSINIERFDTDLN